MYLHILPTVPQNLYISLNLRFSLNLRIFCLICLFLASVYFDYIGLMHLCIMLYTRIGRPCVAYRTGHNRLILPCTAFRVESKRLLCTAYYSALVMISVRNRGDVLSTAEPYICME